MNHKHRNYYASSSCFWINGTGSSKVERYGMIAADIKLFTFKKTNLGATTILLPAFSDPGRVRFNTNATYYLKLFSNLSWNLSFYGNWDNRPPAGFSGSDYGTSSGLSWTFGNG